MPYIITTHRHLDDPTGEFLPGALPGVTRRAVATLEEARRAVRDAYREHRATGAITASDSVTEAGGMVGPLPDGTEIVVERVHSAFPLVSAAQDAGTLPTPSGLRPHDPDLWSKIIDAYNAAFDTRRIA